MIIDLILDRKDGLEYNAKRFYNGVISYHNNQIAVALDSGNNKDVQLALCNYIYNNDYNESICDYINSQIWVNDQRSNTRQV